MAKAVAKKTKAKAPAPAKKAAAAKAHGKREKAETQKPRAPKADATREKVSAVAAPVVAEVVAPKAAPERKKRSAEQMSEMQREISISEFFTKNRHLLGFDNASRALLTSIKEAVDNSLDACEEAGILPDIAVRIEQTSETRYRMTVEDNGPGIVKQQILKVFGKLLYGSKFHRLRQSRGQQGIGISAAVMYGQLTTGKAAEVVSKTGKGKPAYHYKLVIDTKKNEPVAEHAGVEETPHWIAKDHGTSVAIEMEATYKGGKKSIDEFIQQVAFANPHARIEYWRPNGEPTVYPRLTEALPPETKEIKPHPYGVELGMLIRMMDGTASRNLSGFLQAEFSRVSGPVAIEICKAAGVDPEISLKTISQAQIEAVYKAIGQTKIMSPPTNCLAPIGEEALLEGLKALLVQQHFAAEAEKARRKAEADEAKKVDEAAASQQAEAKITEALGQIQAVASYDKDEEDEEEGEEGEAEQAEVTEGQAENIAFARAGVIKVFDKPCFITAVTRAPKVYRGNPFQVEAALAYGGDLDPEELGQVVRFANRVPLLHQPGACAMTQSVARTNWKSYDVQQAKGALPLGPLLVMVHIASVWVPFTSEAKEAVAHYDEIITELKFALQECGRRVSRHLRRRARAADAEKKRKYIEKYIPHIGIALQQILGLTDRTRDQAVDDLTGILERSRKM